MSKERNKADDYREKAYLNCPLAYAASPFGGDAQRSPPSKEGGPAMLITSWGVPEPAIDYCKEHGYK